MGLPDFNSESDKRHHLNGMAQVERLVKAVLTDEIDMALKERDSYVALLSRMIIENPSDNLTESLARRLEIANKKYEISHRIATRVLNAIKMEKK